MYEYIISNNFQISNILCSSNTLILQKHIQHENESHLVYIIIIPKKQWIR